MKPILLIVTILFAGHCFAQHPGILKGQVYAGEAAVPYASVSLQGTDQGTLSDSLGHYTLSGIPAGNYIVSVMAIGYSEKTQAVSIVAEGTATLDFQLQANTSDLNEVVVTGTLKEVSRSKSPVPVEVYTSAFFRKNPTPSLFDALGMINGVQSQINCNVCNTGDIHINGMNGPYTMILIDGMPIVSSLSSVYGLSGIPNSLVDRVEVVKGPASSLYGSEAMGGTINVITKNPTHAPVFSADLYGTTWQEYNADVSVKFKIEKLQSLLGVNYFNYQHPVDNNHDGFADVTLQNRISLFSKWSLSRKENRIASLAARYVYEDRWGGQMNWNSSWRGSDSIYGESIYTSRLELIGMYQLPVQERIITQFSFNNHDQNSFYGYTPYRANQKVLFGQVYWDKYFGQRKQHNFLLGASMRYTYYDDNTPGTATIQQDNQPMKTPLPGIFVQDEWTIDAKNTLLAGYRYDYDKHHGSIHSPGWPTSLPPVISIPSG
ncbi:TonB-dependent receptor [Taibaiella helva]|uniref:TonB-dependent receptor n=1 Tax=Taibaiella helva TaxID=2301235 RepID=UPI0018E4E681|nr:TonB-dependent receptor [Taibaiella helva]